MQIKSILTLAILGPALSSCGPVYQTVYNYKPPRGFKHRECVNRCLTAYQNCRLKCVSINNRVSESNRRQDNFDTWQSQKNPNGYFGGGDFDGPSYVACQCLETYNMCYQNCGGHVRSHQVCTAFCPDTQPNSATVRQRRS